jgi:hypothetical protein
VRVTLIALLASCSFLQPPRPPPRPCTAVVPIVDAAFAAAGYAALIYTASNDDTEAAANGVTFIGLPAAVIGTVYAISAIYGAAKYSGCRDVAR